jgi:hypothetical protein
MQPDPSRPMKGWRTAWRAIRRAAGLPWLRFHDLRHTFLTALAESQTPDIVLLEIAGHTTVRMLRHYAHIRMDAKRKALDSISTTSAPIEPQGEDANVTNHVTAIEKEVESDGEVVDFNGAGYRIRTSDPLLVRQMLYR